MIEVLGTVFSLDAMPQRTGLSVAQGNVRLCRLVDGRDLVAAHPERAAVAAGNAANAIIITTMNLPFGLEVAEISIAPAASAP